MSSREELLESVAETIKDYRQGELATPTKEHVDKWVKQFDEGTQVPILEEMNHVLKKTYFSRERMIAFLRGVLKAERLVKGNPRAFWSDVEFITIQKKGESQKEMLALFGSLLEENYELKIAECKTSSNTFIYLDDAIFSGGRILEDLSLWAKEEAPQKATVHVIVAAKHEGFWFNRENLLKAFRESGKDITPVWYPPMIVLENRKAHKDVSDVLFPIEIKDDPVIKTYVDYLDREIQELIETNKLPKNFSLTWREPKHENRPMIFSSEEGRQTLEREFSKKGIHILEKCTYLKGQKRPLGYMYFSGFGFGSPIVTFRKLSEQRTASSLGGESLVPAFRKKTEQKDFVAEMSGNICHGRASCLCLRKCGCTSPMKSSSFRRHGRSLAGCRIWRRAFLCS